MSVEKKYWQDLVERDNVAEMASGRENEFAEKLPVEEVLADKKFQGANANRRDFLKFLGFSVSAATLAACETPVIKAIPYVNKPEEVTPGIANWYASTYYDGNDYASILVKTREGRPIFIKGNKHYGINKGSVNARINSSVLSLYDSERAKGPSKNLDGSHLGVTWDAMDTEVKAELKKVADAGGNITILSNTVISPSTMFAIGELEMALGGTAADMSEGAEVPAEGAAKKVQHIQYDAISFSGITAANEKSFGKRYLPTYHFEKADVLVSVAADFLSGWLNANEHVADYASRRKPENGPMSRHFQFESRMSIAGSNADVRKLIKPSEEAAVVMSIHDGIAKKVGGTTVGGGSAMDELTAGAVKELLDAKGRSLVVAGSNDANVQLLVNSINDMLGNYGKTVDIAKHSLYKRGDDKATTQLMADMKAGKVDALIIMGCNPAYTLGAAFAEGLGNVKMSISCSSWRDETANLCTHHCPDNHYLESWNDANPRVGHYALAQPVISPLYDTRQAAESILRWAGNNTSYYEYVKGIWARYEVSGDAWNTALHNGSIDPPMPEADGEEIAFAGDVSAAAAALKKRPSGGAWELFLYQKEGIGDGAHAGNPWLQEMPDPISKVTWDNYITMAPSDMEANGFAIYIGEQSPASVASVSMGDVSVELPVYPSPGQKPGTLGIALGYGRGANGEKVGKAACVSGNDGEKAPVGANAYPFTVMLGNERCYAAYDVSMAGTGATYALGITQTHMTDMDRTSVVRETDQETFQAGDRDVFNPEHKLAVHHDMNGDSTVNALDKQHVKDIDLWTAFPVEGVGHRWGMTIDLSSCIGCGACLTACQAENNVPVVGKDEVRRSREMHWIRLDRYYSSSATREDGYTAMEVPAEEPEVTFVPVMCQHCNHAPCETVCPVAATTHSNEGLNQMTYNRCIGTRYCANNCPYKVRRFNWWNYNSPKFDAVNPANDATSRMVLNPDVTVRARGVMEKCSLCVQSIQAGKLQAKKEGRPVKDGEIQTACSDGCPTNAITFGDLNDKNTQVAANAASDRTYKMIEEVGAQPNVHYMVKVRNNGTNA